MSGVFVWLMGYRLFAWFWKGPGDETNFRHPSSLQASFPEFALGD